MKKENKYIYAWVIQGYYGYGWEDVSFYDKKESTYSQVRADLKEYRYKASEPYRLIERRELNENWKASKIENFKKYQKVQMSGMFNMYTESYMAAEVAGLTNDEYWDVIENYGAYKKLCEA